MEWLIDYVTNKDTASTAEASEVSSVTTQGESEENTELLRLSRPPVYFEPISGLTSVFFDRDNEQIFCVRSNGVGGVVAKGTRADANLSFRLEDR